MGSVLGPIPDVRFLEQSSSVIVKGRVLDVRSLGTMEIKGQKTPETVASIHVDEVIKGRISGETITIRHAKVPFPVGIQLEKGSYALYFLKNDQAYVYSFVNSTTARMKVTSRRIPLAESVRLPIEKLSVEVFASLSDPAPDVRAVALEQIDRLGTKNSREKLLAIASSSNAQDKGMAYAGLLHLRNYSLLHQAIRFAQTPTSDQNVRYWQSRIAESIGAIGDNRIQQAFEATKYRQNVKCSSKLLSSKPLDGSILPQLYPLLTSSNVEFRRGAAHALRGICEPSSAPALARALNDADRSVQYDSMMALAAIEDFPVGLPVPSKEEFDQKPNPYVDKWKSWWDSSLRHEPPPSN